MIYISNTEWWSCTLAHILKVLLNTTHGELCFSVILPVNSQMWPQICITSPPKGKNSYISNSFSIHTVSFIMNAPSFDLTLTVLNIDNMSL